MTSSSKIHKMTVSSFRAWFPANSFDMESASLSVSAVCADAAMLDGQKRYEGRECKRGSDRCT